MDDRSGRQKRFAKNLRKLRGVRSWATVAKGACVPYAWLRRAARGIERRGWGNEKYLDALAAYFGINPYQFWRDHEWWIGVEPELLAIAERIMAIARERSDDTFTVLPQDVIREAYRIFSESPIGES